MATNLILTKQSSDTEIRSYFKAILELSKSDNEFPVNLEEVWMLVYPRKDHAVRELRKTFIEGIDYQALPKNGEQDSENTWGGNNRNDYILTIPCLEFFIARKVRAVFEVYRQVFHRKMNVLENISRKDLAKMLYESELEKERLREEVKRKDEEMRAERESITKQDSLPGRVAALEQLVLPGFANLKEGETPEKQERLFVNRIRPSVSKIQYPGAMLTHEVRSRLLLEKGMNVYLRDLFRMLHRIGWIVTDNAVQKMPTAEAIGNGWLLPVACSGHQKNGKSQYHPRMTERGYEKLCELIMQKGGLK